MVILSTLPPKCRILFSSTGDHLDLPSFPTRRSSDLTLATRSDTRNRLSKPQSSDCEALTQAHKRFAIRTLRLGKPVARSEEHTSELQSRRGLVWRPPLGKKK